MENPAVEGRDVGVFAVKLGQLYRRRDPNAIWQALRQTRDA
jgi:hypothetical protein